MQSPTIQDLRARAARAENEYLFGASDTARAYDDWQRAEKEYRAAVLAAEAFGNLTQIGDD